MATSPSEPPDDAAGEADLALLAAAIAAHEARRPPPAPESRWRSAARREGLRG